MRRGDCALVDLLRDEEEVVDVPLLGISDDLVHDGPGRSVESSHVLLGEDAQVDALLDDDVAELRLVLG